MNRNAMCKQRNSLYIGWLGLLEGEKTLRRLRWVPYNAGKETECPTVKRVSVRHLTLHEGQKGRHFTALQREGLQIGSGFHRSKNIGGAGTGESEGWRSSEMRVVTSRTSVHEAFISLSVANEINWLLVAGFALGGSSGGTLGLKIESTEKIRAPIPRLGGVHAPTVSEPVIGCTHDVDTDEEEIQSQETV